MPHERVKPRLAWGAFASSLFTFFGPGIHWSTNPGAPRDQVAVEGAVFGILVGALAIGLAFAALKWAAKREGNPGRGWAQAALGIAGVGLAVWVVALVIGTAI